MSTAVNILTADYSFNLQHIGQWLLTANKRLCSKCYRWLLANEYNQLASYVSKESSLNNRLTHL